MNRRLQQFLSAENISQSQLAENLGVARASISHIIAGRNKPGFDFIEGMARHYPSLNLEWLVTGKGRMYKDNSKVAVNDNLFPVDEVLDADIQHIDIVPERTEDNNVLADKTPAISSITSDKQTQLPNNQRSITKIIVFYDDNTFQELK